MKIIHTAENESIESDSNEFNFILGNKKGGYYYFSERPKSRYQGLFFLEDEKMIKVIDSIHVKGYIKEAINRFCSVDIVRDNVTEKIFMPSNHNSLVYSLDKDEDIEIILDVRESYKFPGLGRNYHIHEEQGKIIVSYWEEGSDSFFIAINKSAYEAPDEWFKRDYDADKKRNSPPDALYVYKALKLRTRLAIFTFSRDKETAIRENDSLIESYQKLLLTQQQEIKNEFVTLPNIEGETQMAYFSAQKSLDILSNCHGRILAGLPWFFQVWGRDELISLKAILIESRYERVKDIIKQNLYDEKKMFGSADALGWLFCRIKDSIGLFNQEELSQITQRLKEFTDKLFKSQTAMSFATNGNQKTWMDSLDRSGFRIEIQALRLLMYRLMSELTNESIYTYLENNLRNEARQKLWNKKVLADGFDDWTVRPNIFIAYYVYPELLTRHEWVNCFSNALHGLWLDWGGLATIHKKDNSFCSRHTGEDPKSYHNGDSWFWINNLAAIVLNRVDKNRFRHEIESILKASTKDILWNGVMGHHSELSSAESQKGEGCLCQAWSSAMYIEMIKELFL